MSREMPRKCFRKTARSSIYFGDMGVFSRPMIRRHRRSAPPRRSIQAFTLIELLVVIGIIAVLLGLLLPTISRVREGANTIKCAAQLRQIGQGIFNYAANHEGMLPAWTGGNHAYPHNYDNDPHLDGPGWATLLESSIGARPDAPLYTC